MSVKKVAPWELQPPSNGPGITRSDAAQNGMIWYSQDLLAVLVHTCHSTLTMHKIHNSHISIYMSHINIYIPFWFFSCQTSSLSCFGTEGGAAENIQYPTMHTSNQTWHDLEPQDILRLFVLPMPSNVEAYPMLLALGMDEYFRSPSDPLTCLVLHKHFVVATHFVANPWEMLI